METKPEQDCCCAKPETPRALPRANRKILTRCAYSFRAIAWIAILYSIAIVVFNWIIMLRSQSPEMPMLIKTGIISSVYQFVVGAIVVCIFLWAEQITWLLLENSVEQA